MLIDECHYFGHWSGLTLNLREYTLQIRAITHVAYVHIENFGYNLVLERSSVCSVATSSLTSLGSSARRETRS